jgi:hypothetical protein
MHGRDGPTNLRVVSELIGQDEAVVAGAKRRMGFDQVKGWIRALLFRVALLSVGIIVLAVSLSLNRNAGRAVLAGLVSPNSPEEIVISVARLLVPTVGLWLVYRGLK